MADALKETKPQQKFIVDVVDRRLSPVSRKLPQRSVTLMRSSVKHPSPAANPRIIPIHTAHSVAKVDSSGLSESASLTQQSPLISRFAAGEVQPIEAPPAIDIHQSYPSIEQYAPPADTLEAPSSSITGSGELAAEWPNLNLDNLLPNTASLATKPQRSKWHMAKHVSGWTILAVVLVGIVGGGIFINRNLSKLELYVASSKVGFSATLPGIKPSGFDLSSIATGSGALQVSFKSNTDSRNYSLTEKKSAISDNQLLTNYVQPQSGQNYQTINAEGRTVYIYNGHDATWIYGGIWYTLLDNNSLSNNQIINLATST